MTDLIISSGDNLTTTSKIIADVFGKTHRHINEAISNLDCSEEFSTANFRQSEYSTERGKTYQCWDITEKGFYFLCMGFTGKAAAKWKESFISEFHRLRLGTMSIDKRMTEISKKLEAVKLDGQLWSKLGREINNNKKIALIGSDKLINEVQLKLDY